MHDRLTRGVGGVTATLAIIVAALALPAATFAGGALTVAPEPTTTTTTVPVTAHAPER